MHNHHSADKNIERFAQEEFKDIILKPKPQLEATLKELTYNSREYPKRLGIDTTIESID